MDKVKISGTLVMILGLILVVASFFTTLFILTYGIPIFLIGLFIFFNRKEDKIEEINYKKGGNKN